MRDCWGWLDVLRWLQSPFFFFFFRVLFLSFFFFLLSSFFLFKLTVMIALWEKKEDVSSGSEWMILTYDKRLPSLRSIINQHLSFSNSLKSLNELTFFFFFFCCCCCCCCCCLILKEYSIASDQNKQAFQSKTKQIRCERLEFCREQGRLFDLIIERCWTLYFYFIFYFLFLIFNF